MEELRRNTRKKRFSYEEKNEKTIGENRKGANFDERVLKDQGYGIPGGGDEVDSMYFIASNVVFRMIN